MNLAHRWLCRSAYWRNTVETYTVGELPLLTRTMVVPAGCRCC